MKPITKAVFLMAVSVLAGGAQAQTFSNGSLTGPLRNDGVPPGWLPKVGQPDTMDASANMGVIGLQAFAAPPSASPDGGTWVGLMGGGDLPEAFATGLSGLVVGHSYRVSWYVANFGYTGGGGFTGSNAIQVRFNNGFVGTGAALATGPSWVEQSAVFVTGFPANELSFLLTNNGRSYLSIDGIRVTEVPEPGSGPLLAAGVALLAASTLRRRRVS